MQVPVTIVQLLPWLLLYAIGSHGLARVRRSACDSNLCQNGGICNNITASPPCICPLPFIAPHCRSAADYCNAKQPDRGINELPVCLNAGVCSVAYKDPYFNCSCAPGFSGIRCEFARSAPPNGPVTPTLTHDEKLFSSTQFPDPGSADENGQLSSFLVKALAIAIPSAVVAVAVIAVVICLCIRYRNCQMASGSKTRYV